MDLLSSNVALWDAGYCNVHTEQERDYSQEFRAPAAAQHTQDIYRIVPHI